MHTNILQIAAEEAVQITMTEPPMLGYTACRGATSVVPEQRNTPATNRWLRVSPALHTQTKASPMEGNTSQENTSGKGIATPLA